MSGWLRSSFAASGSDVEKKDGYPREGQSCSRNQARHVRRKEIQRTRNGCSTQEDSCDDEGGVAGHGVGGQKGFMKMRKHEIIRMKHRRAL